MLGNTQFNDENVNSKLDDFAQFTFAVLSDLLNNTYILIDR